MKPREERLNDRLEHPVSGTRFNGQNPGGSMQSDRIDDHDQEIEELVALARQIREAPQIQVTPDFARQLERRLLRFNAEHRLQMHHRRHPHWPGWRSRLSARAGISLCLLLCLLIGLLIIAAQVTSPTNPLYALKRLEQQAQTSLAGSAEKQAELDLQFARERLNTLTSLADVNHEAAYNQALADLSQQLATSATAIQNLPAGPTRDHLTGELLSLQTETGQVLRRLLPQLPLSASLATTDELVHLGEQVLHLTGAIVTLPAHPNGQATVLLMGTNIQPGAHLLVNGRIIEANGILQDNQITFVVKWRGEQHPESLGLRNPDGTVAQITAVTIEGANTDGSHQNGNGKKPSITPTPNGNGNQPTVTPTPKGHKPSVTPTTHH